MLPRPAVLARLVVVAAAVVPSGGVLAAVPAHAATTPAPVVLVGTAGVQWADVSPSATPHLAALAEQGAIGDVAVRSVRRAACPVDGWLALSAGRRAADAVDASTGDAASPSCRAPEVQGGVAAGGSATVSTWQRYVQAADAEKFDATPGLLGDALASAGTCATAVGPGAAVALARRDGTVARYLPSVADAGPALAAADCPLAVVDAGSVRDPEDAPEGPAEQGVAVGGGDRAAQVRAVDAVVGQVLDAVPDGARVLVVSLGDSGRTPHLQLVGAVGPGFGPGFLRTSSTRQVALVQATDLAPSVLSLLGVPAPGDLVGSPLQTLAAADGDAPEATADRLRKVADLEQAAQSVQSLVSPFFNGLVIAQLLLYGAAAVVLRRRWAAGDGRRRLLVAVRRVALVFAAVPVSTYLANTVPWWRSSHPLLVVVLAVAAYTAAVSLVAQLGPWRRAPLGPFGAVAALTCVVLAADIVTGSRLQTSSLMGLQPVVAGRFYGFSNVAFALFATGAMLLAIAVADQLVTAGRRRAAAAAVALIGVVATVLDVSPQWGSDFGGPIGMVPAFAVLVLLVAGVRLSWLKALAIGAGTVLLLALVSVADWLRPADQRTHLGRFVQTVIDGGAWQVISRKAEQNLSILFGSFLSLLVPVAALFVVLVLMRPSSWGAGALARAYDRSPILRHGLFCLMLLLGIGFAVNDSGTAIPAVGFTLAIPLVIAASLRALEDDEPPAARAPATAPDPATA
ncbi:hypothetical protein [Angustibacter peucedani]